MRLHKLTLNEIKKYNKVFSCDFSESEGINTISGRNGSGKTTIFEALLLLQKAYFIDKLYRNNIITYKGKDMLTIVGKEFFDLAKGKNAYVEADFIFDEDDLQILSSKYKEKYENIIRNKELEFPYIVEIRIEVVDIKKESVNWEVYAKSDDQKEFLDLFWNIEDPKNIIAYIFAEHNVIEKNLTFQDINLKSESNILPILKFVIEPNEIYTNLYNTMINDYIYERIIPQSRRKDYYEVNAKSMFKELLPNLNISNFSGTNRKDQFILLGNNGGKNFDIRNFSSGEKLIWYTVLLLNYIGNMGILVIDEPENHLHEELAWKFINMLADISKLKFKNNKGNLSLSQTFLITHSKNIIYNNFSSGINYVIDNDNLKRIDYKQCENKLRMYGISYINDKILFVEGDTDYELLENVLAKENIHVKILGNCAEIIRTYEGIRRIKDYILGTRFAFLIDRDTRDNNTIEDLRNKDEEYFDMHFMVMPVHEMENYFLDEIRISKAIEPVCMAINVNLLKETEILGIMKNFADQQLDNTKKKYLNETVRNKICLAQKMVNQRDIPIDNQSEFDKYINGLFSNEEWRELLDEIKGAYGKMCEKYEETKWESDWKSLADGKAVFHQTINEMSRKVGISKENLEKTIKDYLVNDRESELSKLLDNIYSIYE